MTSEFKPPARLILWLTIGMGVGLILAASDGNGLTLASWAAYALLAAISTLLIYVVWKTMRSEAAPTWLLTAALIGFALRLGVGLALYRALPVYGYGENAERAGYVYWDAYKRDTDAYDRGRGDTALLNAFSDPKRSDQYGGLLFISAGIYRYLGTAEHRPLLPVTFLAGLSSLAILLSWGVGKRLFNENVAAGAAWIAALYPEAVLLGASQMREPFLITAFAASFYGYLVARDGSPWRGLLWILGAVVVLTLPVSPPFVAVILITLLLAKVWEARTLNPGSIALLAFGLVIVLAAGLIAAGAWSGLEAIEGTPIEIIKAWLGNSVAGWRITRVTEQSAWLDTLLTDTPDPLQVPFLVLFGLVQPFLPAALVAPGSALWKSIAIWRSLGWFLILPLLIYGTIGTIRRFGWKHLSAFLGIFIWISALIASYRAPSYQWDNPRYRTVFLVVQTVIAAWAWWHARMEADPWLKHISILIGGNTLIFTYWYLGRYTSLPKLAFLHNLVLIGVFSGLYLAAVLLLPKSRSSARLTEDSNRDEV